MGLTYMRCWLFHDGPYDGLHIHDDEPPPKQVWLWGRDPLSPVQGPYVSEKEDVPEDREAVPYHLETLRPRVAEYRHGEEPELEPVPSVKEKELMKA
jgi:hypothetical protein